MRSIYVALACAMAVPTLAHAQPTTPAPGTLAVGAAAGNMLRTGTEIQLKLEEPLTTEGKNLRVGQHFRLSVIEPVVVDGNLITARFPYDLPRMVQALVKQLVG